MGNPLHIWWTVVWVWVVITVMWFVSNPLVTAIMDSTASFCTTTEAILVLNWSRFSWNYFPIIFMVGMVIWAIWASLKPDVETMERYYGY